MAVTGARTGTITSISKLRGISDFKSFSESCPYMLRDKTNIKNYLFNKDFPTDCKPEVCPFVGGDIHDVLCVPW